MEFRYKGTMTANTSYMFICYVTLKRINLYITTLD